MLTVEATLWLYASDAGGLRDALRNPSVSLLLEPAVPDLYQRAGWNFLAVKISTSNGRDIEAGEHDVAAEIVFLTDEATPWIEVGGEFHLVMTPRRVGHGRVDRVVEDVVVGPTD